jgi:hypothetical protein
MVAQGATGKLVLILPKSATGAMVCPTVGAIGIFPDVVVIITLMKIQG